MRLHRVIRMRRSHLVIGSLMLAIAVFIATMSAAKDPPPDQCRVGKAPSLDVSRHAEDTAGGKPIVVACGSTHFGPLEVVAFKNGNADCWSADFPMLGLSQGGDCLNYGELWDERCSELCITSVTRIGGHDVGTLVLGSLGLPTSRVIVAGQRRRAKIRARVFVVDRNGSRSGTTNERQPVFIAVFSQCVASDSVKAVADSTEGAELKDQYSFPNVRCKAN